MMSIKTTAVAAFLMAAVANAESNSTKPVYGLYLAGPEVFLHDPIAAGEASKAACEKANEPSLPFEIKANYPLDAQIEDFAYDHATGYKIFYANVNLIDSSVGTVANMVRFRSPSMDVGTSWEMGYTAGQGKPVFGYYDAVPFYGETEEPGTYPEKVVQYGYADENNTGYDHDNLEIEGFGFSDNLMLLGNLEMTGYEQHETVYESCLDAVDWISKNCMGPDSTCLTIDGEKKSPNSDVSVEMTAAVNSGASVHTSSALLAAGAAIAVVFLV